MFNPATGEKGVWMFSHESSNHPNAISMNGKSRMSPLCDSGRFGMGMLWEVKGQDQRFGASVDDLHATI